MKEKDRGITLIALVITVIILLLLAGITQSILIGEKGIIKQANEAKEKSEISAEKEIIQLAVLTARENNEFNILRSEDLQQQIDEKIARVYDEGDEITLVFNTNRMYTIDTNGYIIEEGLKYELATKKLSQELENNTYGTIEKPYEINCIEDLLDLSYKVNGIIVDESGVLTYTNTRNAFVNKYIILKKNLNFKSELSYEDKTRTDYGDVNKNGIVEELFVETTTGNGWIPIGGCGQSEAETFNGNFIGNNKTISNLYINNENETSFAGLFGRTNMARIENLHIKPNIYCNSTYAAGIVAYCWGGEISNCSFNGRMENVKENIRSITAGIIGYANEGCNIEECYSKGEIIGKFQAAGILGTGTSTISKCYNDSSIFNESNDSYSSIGGIAANGGNSDIIDCYNKGKVEGPRNAGGITGGGVKKAENCYNSGHIISESSAGGINGGKTNGYTMDFIKCYNIGKIEGGNDVGGICAYNWVIGVSTFDQCYNFGEVIGNNNACGITGHIQVEGGKISNCYNFGKLTGARVFGIAFANSDTIKTISCYNAGELNGTTKYGVSNRGSIENCYYLTNCGVATENATEVTSEELKNIDTLLDKAFAINEENDSITISEQEKQNIWTKDNENKNNGYPIFNWQ